MEVRQLIQLCDVVPARVYQPTGAGVVHLVLLIKYLHTLHLSISIHANFQSKNQIKPDNNKSNGEDR